MNSRAAALARRRNADARNALATRPVRVPQVSTFEWHQASRRELRAPDVPLHVSPVVACLNIWNDRPALEQTLPSWIGSVDALVVADGPYRATGHTGSSTDGLQEYLATLPVPVHHLRVSGETWDDQIQKRTALMQGAAALFPDAVLFIVDADEGVTNAERLRDPIGDVGWVVMTSPIYGRPYGQPRLIRARPDLRYDARHHWLMAGDTLLATHQYGGTGWLHTVTGVSVHNNRGLGHSAERAEAKKRARLAAAPVEARAITTPSDAQTGARESLRILMAGHADHGFVAYRLLTAINATTPHAAVLVTSSQKNRLRGPMQFNSDNPEEWAAMRDAGRGADVIHCHVDYSVALRLGNRAIPVVIHHHGTMYRKNARNKNAEDRHRADVRLVSNLELLRYDSGLTWLPNPMPVGLYRRVRGMMRVESGKFRIAHSPSRRDYKGTAPFLAACAALVAKGLPIEPVLIENMAHADAIRMKATCHAVFDSFWLGIQCSGLEGAAMGLPVIAGDPYVREQYQQVVGQVPYTYANDQAELELAIEQLVTDQDFRETETARVSTYCERFHDEAAVALRYLDILDEAIHWRTTLQRARRVR